MANTVIELRNSYVSGNVPTSLANGEIAINTYDGKLFYRGGVSNTIQTIERYQGPAGLNGEIQFNDSGVLGANAHLSFNKTTGLLSARLIRSTQSTGDEGGQLDLATATTNQSLAGGSVAIDIYQNKLRIFETGGTNRGVYIDIANGASAGVGTDLLSPSSSSDGWARNLANAAFIAANSAGVYANSAFAAANAATATDTTQNNIITASFTAANSAGVYANGAFAKANNEGGVNLTQNNSITAAFTRANNSLDANNGGTVTGTITATSFITTGSFGNITGANTIYANNIVANTGYIQFADGSKQYTANAGSGGGTTDFGFGVIYTPNNTTYANATTANATLTIVGESGTVVYANATTKTITVAGTPGAQGLTVDYGFVNDPIYYSIDYGALA